MAGVHAGELESGDRAHGLVGVSAGGRWGEAGAGLSLVRLGRRGLGTARGLSRTVSLWWWRGLRGFSGGTFGVPSGVLRAWTPEPRGCGR